MKESLNSDGQLFHHYWQNERIISHLSSLNSKKNTTYDDGNQGPVLAQAQKVARLNW